MKNEKCVQGLFDLLGYTVYIYILFFINMLSVMICVALHCH